MANKKTQRDFFAEIREIVAQAGRTDLVEFVDGRVAVLDNKKSKVSTKRTEEIDKNTALVFDALVNVGKAVTVTELIKSATNEVADFSGQKVSAYLKKLIEVGKVVKTEDKRVSYFKAVAEIEDAE
jgi:DNA-binding transcriptional regulator GbsR (MarR family)